MKTTYVMELYDNLHKKPRRLKGTYLYVFRHYASMAAMAFGGLCYTAFYFTPLHDDVREKCRTDALDETKGVKSTLQSTMVFPKSSKDLMKEYLQERKNNDLSGAS